jgi:hypothetical protein
MLSPVCLTDFSLILTRPNSHLRFYRPECSAGRHVYITDCDAEMTTTWNWLVTGDGSAFIKIANTTLCLSTDGTSDVVSTQVCNENNSFQRWNLNGGNSTWGSKFELQPVGNTTLCAHNTHQPTSGEIVFLQDCAIARYDTTSYWTMY